MKTWWVVAILLLEVFGIPYLAFGQIWTSNSAFFCNSAGVSANGAIMISADGDAGVNISTNSGATWTNLPQTVFGAYPNSAASSANGNPLYVSGGGLYVSTNLGTTWTPLTNAPVGIALLSSSADGTKIVGQLNYSIYTSTNSGVTWFSKYLGRNPVAATCSADGSKWVLTDNNRIYTSTNSGISWITNVVVQGSCSSVASSADGTKLAATVNDGTVGYVEVSTNAGMSWISNNIPGITPMASIASSADGNNLLMVASGTGWPFTAIYTSTNCGISWVSNSVPITSNGTTPLSAISSPDSDKLTVFVGRTMWISKRTPAPHLNLVPKRNDLAISWLVPSTNFVLQQNSDLTTTDWVTLTNTPTLNLSNLNDEVVLSPTNRSGFFRLMSQ